jgi:hypothetical protein
MSTDHDNVVIGEQGILQADARNIAERQLVRKLDSRLLTTSSLSYFSTTLMCVACVLQRATVWLIDITVVSGQRTSIASARLKNLQADLGLSGMFSLTLRPNNSPRLQTSSMIQSLRSFMYHTLLHRFRPIL